MASDTSSGIRRHRHRPRICHFCRLPLASEERAIRAKTGNGWAHFTCWYDGGPFERRARGRR